MEHLCPDSQHPWYRPGQNFRVPMRVEGHQQSWESSFTVPLRYDRFCLC